MEKTEEEKLLDTFISPDDSDYKFDEPLDEIDDKTKPQKEEPEQNENSDDSKQNKKTGEKEKTDKEQSEEADKSDSKTGNGTNDEPELTEEQLEEKFYTSLIKNVAEELNLELSEGVFIKTEDDLKQALKEIGSYAKTSFVDPEVEKLNSYLLQGGNIKDYAKHILSDEVESFESFATKEVVTKDEKTALVKAYYKNIGLDQQTAEIALSNIKEDLLESNVEKAKEYFKSQHEAQKNKLFEEQKRQKEEALANQQKVIYSYKQFIESTNSIHGHELKTSKEKEELLNYLLVRKETTGKTEFQEFIEGGVENQLALAFIIKKGLYKNTNIQKLIDNKAAQSLGKSIAKQKYQTAKSQNVVPSSQDELFKQIEKELQ